MFHNIPNPILERMKYLETVDARDRQDGTPRMQRLRQIPPETGKFLALMAAAAPAGKVIEVGTSAGYSTLWLALACRQSGRRMTTFEVLDEKVKLAKEAVPQKSAGRFSRSNSKYEPSGVSLSLKKGNCSPSVGN
ncbi:MAG: hypothetical protein GY759_17875 [Chloroflexi bacterium]|nr:hypothetical protein [Chloroflexota bacterium]